MALTIASTALTGLEDPERIGRYLYQTRLWTLSSTYVTGGHAASAADLRIPSLGGLILVEFLDGVFVPTAGTTAVIARWSPGATQATRGNVQFFWTGAVVSTALAEVTNATSLATFAGRVRVKYIG